MTVIRSRPPVQDDSQVTPGDIIDALSNGALMLSCAQAEFVVKGIMTATEHFGHAWDTQVAVYHSINLLIVTFKVGPEEFEVNMQFPF